MPAAVGAAQLTLQEPLPPGSALRYASIPPAESPGELREVGAEEGLSLQSGGMLWFEIVDDFGVPLEQMPVVDIELDVAGFEAVPEAEAWQAYGMGEDGQWDQPREPQMIAGGALAFPAAQFGFWNADRNFRTACVKGTVATPGGSCGGGRVKATGPDSISSFDSTGEDGSFCVMGAQTFSSTLQIGGGFSTSIQMPSNAGDCSEPDTCVDLGDLDVPDGSCDVQPLAGVGDPCTGDQECVPGSVCFSEYCVGQGNMRISLAFNVVSDFDLHVRTPLGSEIYFANESADGGVLDVDQCVGSCEPGSHAENIVFHGMAPAGTYTVWVVNFDGAADGPFMIEVAGADIMESFSGSLPAVSGAMSEQFTFTL